MEHRVLFPLAPRFRPYALWLLTMEGLVVAAEALMLWALWRRHASLSLCAAVSCALLANAARPWATSPGISLCGP